MLLVKFKWCGLRRKKEWIALEATLHGEAPTLWEFPAAHATATELIQPLRILNCSRV